ncbi:hypothetical protein B0H17DRAFT_420623 [Mycena rosella]|uniref:Uncharacterized protein n=1 Tax=Mycena rosella TaxID=1033263 RepID=A0AAD7CHI3_MYCRO|nr:hypothetical protein B0H17DRAFT_420623 [Mycena rosella]
MSSERAFRRVLDSVHSAGLSLLTERPHPTRTRFGPYHFFDPHPHSTRFKPHENQPGVARPYHRVTQSHVEYSSRIARKLIVVSESIDACVITPAIAATVTTTLGMCIATCSNVHPVSRAPQQPACTQGMV